jgi:methanogenesis imperfect marker protein 11
VHTLEDPYVVAYKQIHAVADPNGDLVEILERTTCYGGSAWARYHYTKSPLVIDSRAIGEWFRYIVQPEIEITYAGLGGGGVGATLTRARAGDVQRYLVTESGGGKVARGTIVVPRRERVVIGVDDTDNKTTGATWCLIHNIASKVDRQEARYLSHALVQLFPVPTKTQNCVSTAVEFACLPGQADEMLDDFKVLVQEFSVSENTGMAVYKGFNPSILMPYAQRCKRERLTYDDAIDAAKLAGVDIAIDGRGLIGAVAALPYFSRSDESVIPGI